MTDHGRIRWCAIGVVILCLVLVLGCNGGGLMMKGSGTRNMDAALAEALIARFLHATRRIDLPEDGWKPLLTEEARSRGICGPDRGPSVMPGYEAKVWWLRQDGDLAEVEFRVLDKQSPHVYSKLNSPFKVTFKRTPEGWLIHDTEEQRHSEQHQ